MSKKDRVINFAAGPSMMPIEILNKAAGELTSWNDCGQSVMELSHRSQEFGEIISEAEKNLRDIMNIPENYRVLFLQGGGTLQFSMIPLNLLYGSGKADYIVTGSWAKKAAKEASKFGDIKIIASSEEENFTFIPKIKREDIRTDADYVYVCWNNTIYGSHFNYIPDTGDIPLVADMSSSILSEEIDVSKFGIIFAGAQKNLGPAGVTVVIIREDLIGHGGDKIPVYLDYSTHSKKDSMYNTPPCFNIYMAGENFRHVKELGGVPEIHRRDAKKAKMLYDYIDESNLYNCPVAKEDRSITNIVFVTGNKELDKKFVEESKKRGMVNLNGHRSVGGMRASLYNAMPEEGVERLLEFMKEFEDKNL